ncbi:hypothetical protein AMS68_004752 [Peltaster fructicola]|uniref:phosphoserine phosphatase n=1 Tax=Peltaster fructicola TaxID=286661 RepID=A0A6H0XX44_9PEZI|nr:hypothetical protein AMS68_004752 [Peltaster fructicola]
MASIYAFSKASLTHEQWTEHVRNALQPALQEAQLLSTVPEIHPLATESSGQSRVAQIVLSTPHALSLTQCSQLCKQTLQDVQQQSRIEYAIIPKALDEAHKKPGLAVFDMDSTLIQQEVIDELARANGFYDKVAAITEAAMRGEGPYSDFTASLKARVALLQGVPTTTWEELKKSKITLTPGARELTKTLKALGWKTAVLSGGFTPLANWIKDILGLDYAYANHLVADEAQGILTGELVSDKPIVHAEKKRELLLEIAAKEGIPLERVIAVGDGSNDLKMMEVAGLGIAFHAKPKVQALAPVRLNSESLLDVMHILGYKKSEIDNLLASR